MVRPNDLTKNVRLAYKALFSETSNDHGIDMLPVISKGSRRLKVVGME